MVEIEKEEMIIRIIERLLDPVERIRLLFFSAVENIILSSQQNMGQRFIEKGMLEAISSLIQESETQPSGLKPVIRESFRFLARIVNLDLVDEEGIQQIAASPLIGVATHLIENKMDEEMKVSLFLYEMNKHGVEISPIEFDTSLSPTTLEHQLYLSSLVQSDLGLQLASQTLTQFRCPLEEFTLSFESCLKNYSSNPEEEAITNSSDKNPVKPKTLLTVALAEMSSQVESWKSYCRANAIALELLCERETQISEELLTSVLARAKPLSIEIADTGVKEALNSVISKAFELLIQLLVKTPECMFLEGSPEKNGVILDTALEALGQQDFDSDVIESGMRFLGLYGKNFPEFLSIKLKECVESFLTLMKSSDNPEVKANGITIISCVFSKSEHSLEQNASVYTLLLEYCNHEDLRIICEALNAIFDIYSEENYDQVLKEGNFLQTFQPHIQALGEKIEREGDDFEENEVEFFQETLENLEGFIEYKTPALS